VVCVKLRGRRLLGGVRDGRAAPDEVCGATVRRRASDWRGSMLRPRVLEDFTAIDFDLVKIFFSRKARRAPCAEPLRPRGTPSLGMVSNISASRSAYREVRAFGDLRRQLPDRHRRPAASMPASANAGKRLRTRTHDSARAPSAMKVPASSRVAAPILRRPGTGKRKRRTMIASHDCIRDSFGQAGPSSHGACG